MTDQETWREGLPAPYYERIVHEVGNIIIHHSATSNDLTDYTNVVRNIYLSHTLVNIQGSIIYVENFVQSKNKQLFLNPPAALPGIYFLVFVSDNNIFSERIILY